MLFAPTKIHPRQAALLAAFTLYGVWGSPTPAAFGAIEILIGLCLVAAMTPLHLAAVFSGAALWLGKPAERFLTACFLALLVPLSVIGLVNGHAPGDVLRDVIPLGFFFLPLFLDDAKHKPVLLCGLIFTGVAFALRFWPTSGLHYLLYGEDRSDEKLLYLSNSPSLLFSGLYLLFQTIAPEQRRLILRLLALAASALCLGALLITLQRGALLFGGVAIYAVFLHRAARSPHFLFCIALSLAVILALFGPGILAMLAHVWQKTLSVGDNARIAEFLSVTERLGGNPFHWLFGLGWGAKVVTAASGHAEVRYTHSLVSYCLLKGGLLALGAAFAYGVFMARRLWQSLRHAPPIALAALPSFILGFTVYPSFKMLCFGAMLALIHQTGHPNNDPD